MQVWRLPLYTHTYKKRLMLNVHLSFISMCLWSIPFPHFFCVLQHFWIELLFYLCGDCMPIFNVWCLPIHYNYAIIYRDNLIFVPMIFNFIVVYHAYTKMVKLIIINYIIIIIHIFLGYDKYTEIPFWYYDTDVLEIIQIWWKKSVSPWCRLLISFAIIVNC